MNRGRKSVRHFLWLFTLIAALLFCGKPFNASGGDWEWKNLLPQGNCPLGIWGSSDSNVFTLKRNGNIHHNNSNTRPITSNRTGTWLVRSNGDFGKSPRLSTSMPSFLSAIWGSSGIDVFAVGTQIGPSTRGLIEHYDGSTWKYMNSGTTQRLYGIWGSSGTNVFAVGIWAPSSITTAAPGPP